MPKYLIQGSYTAEGVKGLLKDGGTARKTLVEQMMKSAGGKLEALYFAFGGADVCAIVDAPDNVTAAALSLAASSSRGTTTIRSPSSRSVRGDRLRRRSRGSCGRRRSHLHQDPAKLRSRRLPSSRRTPRHGKSW